MGKSSLANILLGKPPGGRWCPDCPFYVCDDGRTLCTQSNQIEVGVYGGNSKKYAKVAIADTPGYGTDLNEDQRRMKSMSDSFINDIQYANVVLLALNGKDDFIDPSTLFLLEYVLCIYFSILDKNF